MSSQQEMREEGRAVPVADAPPGGEHGIPVRITLTSAEMVALALAERKKVLAERKKWFREMRGWLMVLATLAASVAYQAGLNPPGGCWQDTKPGDNGHRAGDPVLRDEHWTRYILFQYFNATAFVTSLVIMVLLMSERFYHTEDKVVALTFITFVELASLVGAYIAGATRYASSWVYIIILTIVSFICVIYMGELMGEICAFVLRRIKCMCNLAKLNWFPVPADVVTKSLPDEEAEERRKRANKRSKRPCCPCCGPSKSPERRDVEGQ